MPALGRCVPHLASVTWFWLAAGLPAQEVMPTEVLRGRVVTPEGRPVANAAFEVRRRAISFTCLDLDFLRATRVVRRARTAKDGTFAVHLPLGLACELHLDVAPYARVRLDPVFCGDDLRIALQPAATLEGQVRVQGIGRPCAGARVDVFDPNGYGNRVRTTTDARGAFRIARLSPARYTVRVAPVDATQTFQLVGLRAGQTVRVELESEPGKLLAGVLTDADSGRPVAGAEIGEGWAYSKTVSTDARGRFAMHGFGSRGYVGVYFRAPGYASSQLRHPRDPRMAVPIGEQRLPPLPLDTRDLHLELRRGHRLVGRVLRPDGKPLAGVYVAATEPGAWPSARTDARGRFQIDGLGHGIERTLLLHHDDFATSLYDLPPLPVGKATQDLRADPFALQPRHIVVFRVLDAAGAPWRGEAYLWGFNTDRDRLAENGHVARPLGGVEHHVAKRRVRTDPRGFCAFGDLPTGRFRLKVADAVVREIEVAAGQLPQRCDIRVR